MAKLFIHIGLPKTATTTLQKGLFVKLSEQHRIKYLGLEGHREDNKNSFIKSLVKSINNDGNRIEIQKQLESMLLNNQNLLLSEENIILSSPKTEWKERLDNLYEIVKPFDFKIIVTVREPAKAMFSFYTQYFNHYKGDKRKFIDIALNDDFIAIYRYEALVNKLIDTFGKQNIFVKKFEDIINNEYKDLLKVMDVDDSVLSSNELKNFNSKQRTSDSVVKKTNVSVLSVLANAGKKVGLHKVSNLKKIANKLTWLNKVELTTKDKLKLPSDDDFKHLNETLNSDLTILKEEFGIDYLNYYQK
jgi:hypothetical protein